MKKILLLVIITLVFSNIQAQKEKIKGNKIVVTEQKNLDPFHTIQLYDDFEITLTEDNENIATIEADSNLQEFITVEVHDSILEVKSRRDIKRSKELTIKISYAQELKKILAYNKIQLKSGSLIKSTNLRIESNDNTEVFLSIETDKLTAITNGKSTVDLHTNAAEAFYQVNESSELKGILDTDLLKLDLYQKASSKLEGEAKSIVLRMDRNTNFYGQKLKTDTASVSAEGTSDCYILCHKEITIEATDQTEIYLLGDDPKVTMTTFSNEATLYKKKNNYSPGLLSR